jgi:15-cis-phytoene desaturase
MSASTSSSEIIHTDVAVLGGGIAGLTTAVAAVDHGLDVVVVERDSILGGRARNWVDEKTGDPVHIGPHIFLTEYPNMLKLMDKGGTRDRVVWEEDQLIKIVEGDREIVGRTWKLPAPLHFIPSWLADPGVPLAHKLTAIRPILFALQMDEEDVLALDEMNGYAYLKQMGVTDTYIRRFWDSTSMYIMNAPIDLVSAGALMRFLRFLLGRTDYKIGFPDGGLGDVWVPGTRAYIEARGGQVMTRTTVTEVLREGDRATGLRLADGRTILASRVVIAAPARNALEVLPHDWVMRHESLGDFTAFHPVPYIAVYLWFDRKLSTGKFWARIYKPGDLNSDFYDLSNINTGWSARPSFITSNIIYSSRLADMSDETVVRRTVDEIADYLPGVRDAKLEHWVVNRVPMAVHGPFPGTERRRPPNRTPISGLYVAGDWTRTHLPASMESAAKSGWMCAEAILEDLGRPTSLALQHQPPSGVAGIYAKLANAMPTKSVPRWLRHRLGAAAR